MVCGVVVTVKDWAGYSKFESVHVAVFGGDNVLSTHFLKSSAK